MEAYVFASYLYVLYQVKNCKQANAPKSFLFLATIINRPKVLSGVLAMVASVLLAVVVNCLDMSEFLLCFEYLGSKICFLYVNGRQPC